MRRYILLQYMHGQKSDVPSSMIGTFDDLRNAQAFAGDHMRDFNEIVDSHTWAVVWRLNKSAART
jgi:hypothetical protein